MVNNDQFEEPLKVIVQGQGYPIHIGYHLLSESLLFNSRLHQKHVFILSHPEIAAHFLPALTQTCQSAGAYQIDSFLIPAGDEHKTLACAMQIWDDMLARHCHRDTVVIGLGGGVIGDLAGFCAACFMRGVEVIQCPTSLLAQIDASIGGKTGVNHPLGKNLIGSFHQPTAVIIDLDTLKTLSNREYIAGIGELIKYAVAFDPVLFDWLESHLAQVMMRDPSVLPKVIRWACDIKARIVSQDAREKGARIFLNFGHTIAHSLESLLDYKKCLHGEAVAIGMRVAMSLSLQRGWITPDLCDRFNTLLTRAELPTAFPKEITVDALLGKMKHDKKHSHQTLQWILLKHLGKPVLCGDLTREEIVTALVACGAKL